MFYHIVELCIFAVIPLIPYLIKLIYFKEVDIMDVIKDIIIEIIIQHFVGAISGPLAVEKA